MKKQVILIPALIIALVITGCFVYSWRQSQVASEDVSGGSNAVNATPTPTSSNNSSTTEEQANESETPTQQTVRLYLTALGDTSAQNFGCGDGLVGVDKQLTTATPLTDAIKSLLAIKEEYYGQSGLYNALWQSDLSVGSVIIANGVAKIELNGQLKLSGSCDSPRVKEQLVATATQFASVSSAEIMLNGQPLDKALSAQ